MPDLLFRLLSVSHLKHPVCCRFLWPIFTHSAFTDTLTCTESIHVCRCSYVHMYVCIYSMHTYSHTHGFVCPSRQRALAIADADTMSGPAWPLLHFGVCVCVLCVVCVCVCVFESCCFIIDYGFEVVLAMTSSLHSLSVFHKFKLLIF